MNTPNSQNRVSLDTEVLLVRRLFAFSNNTRTITSNYIPAISSNSEVKWYNTLENISTYGAGWLPDVHSNLSTVTGLTCNYLLGNLSNAASNLGFVGYAEFSNLSATVSTQSNVLGTQIYTMSNVWIPTQNSILSNSINDLSNFFVTYATGTSNAVLRYQFLSATNSLQAQIRGLSSYVCNYNYSNDINISNLSTNLYRTSNVLQGQITGLSNVTPNNTAFSNLSTYVSIISIQAYNYYTLNYTANLGTLQKLSNTDAMVASNASNIIITSNALQQNITNLSNWAGSFVVPVTDEDLTSTKDGIFKYARFDGNVGIFVDPPAYALDVNGTANVSNLIVNGLGFNTFSTFTMSNFSTLSSYVNTIGGSGTSNLSNLSTFVSNINVNVSNLSVYTLALSNYTNGLSNYTTLIDGKVTALSNYTTTLDGKITVLSNYTTALSNYTTTIDGKVTGLSNYTTSLSNYTTIIDGKVTGLSNYTTALSNYTTTIDGKVTALSNYTTTIDTKVTGLSNYTTALSNYTTTIDTRVTGLSNYTTALSNYTTTIDTRVTGLSNYTTALSNYTTTIDTRVTGLSNYTTALSNYTASIDDKVTGLSNYTTALSNYTTTIDTKVEGLSNFTSNYSTLLSYPNMTLSTLLVSAGSIGIGVSSRTYLSAALDINNIDIDYNKFYVRSNDSPYLIVSSNGYVGINCNTPQIELDVNGVINTTVLNATQVIQAPYVIQTAPKIYVYNSNYTIATPGGYLQLSNIYGNYPLLPYETFDSTMYKAPFNGLYSVELEAIYKSDSALTHGPAVVEWLQSNVGYTSNTTFYYTISGVNTGGGGAKNTTNTILSKQIKYLTSNDYLSFRAALPTAASITNPYLMIQYYG